MAGVGAEHLEPPTLIIFIHIYNLDKTKNIQLESQNLHPTIKTFHTSVSYFTVYHITTCFEPQNLAI
jgi:hypothetical protein